MCGCQCGCPGVGRVKDGSVFLHCCTAQGEWEGCFRFGVDSGFSVFLPLSPYPSLSRVSCAVFLREAPTGLGTFRRGPDAPLQPPVALPGSLTSPWLSPFLSESRDEDGPTSWIVVVKVKWLICHSHQGYNWDTFNDMKAHSQCNVDWKKGEVWSHFLKIMHMCVCVYIYNRKNAFFSWLFYILNFLW